MGFSLLLLKDLVQSSWGQSNDAQGSTQLLLSLLFPVQTVPVDSLPLRLTQISS